MELRTLSAPLAQVETDWLLLPVWEDGPSPAAAAADQAMGGVIARLRESKDVAGKSAELTPLYQPTGLRAARVLVVGLGKKGECTRDALHRAGIAAGKLVSQKQRKNVAVALPESANGLEPADMLLSLAAGLARGVCGPGLRQSEPKRFAPEQLTFLAESCEFEPLLRRASAEARAVQLARDLVNEPPCDKYPQRLAEIAAEQARSFGVECTILDEKQIAAERMGSLLGVAQGSARPPRVVVLRYRGGKGDRTLAYIGKGVTFDSGGLSLKSNEQMLEMKCDMAGAATVLAAMTAVAELKLPVNALGVMALVENLPSGTAMKLGDVLKARNGKTIEVHNTDAEGRLILADALAYAVDQKASHLVDLATLTGACMIALGTEVAGLMTNNQPWADQVMQSVQSAGERAWQLPMFPDYGELIKSPVADIKNVGGKFAGAITAAKFLEQFVGTTPWVHLDIAGPAFVSEENATRDAGGTGCFVRSLVELAGRYKG